VGLGEALAVLGAMLVLPYLCGFEDFGITLEVSQVGSNFIVFAFGLRGRSSLRG